MHQHDLSFSFKGRYFKLGEINEQTSQIWFVLHGYGQLAEFFIRKFKSLEGRNCCVIAPEGLSRFYHSEIQETGRRANDKIGASWMTKENRLSDIENYIEYLNAVYRKEIPATLSAKVTILGFSQGAATASRWVTNDEVAFDRLILWAGAFPPDIDFTKGKEVLKSKKIFEVYGTEDLFINEERMKELQRLNEQLEIKPVMIQFQGKHEIDEPTLLSLF
jgi:predicted esterase